MPFKSEAQRRFIFAKAKEGKDWAKKFIKHSKKRKKKVITMSENLLDEIKYFKSIVEDENAGVAVKPTIVTPEAPPPAEAPAEPENPIEIIMKKADDVDKLLKDLLNANSASKKLAKINEEFELLIADIAKLQIDQNKNETAK